MRATIARASAPGAAWRREAAERMAEVAMIAIVLMGKNRVEMLVNHELAIFASQGVAAAPRDGAPNLAVQSTTSTR